MKAASDKSFQVTRPHVKAHHWGRVELRVVKCLSRTRWESRGWSATAPPLPRARCPFTFRNAAPDSAPSAQLDFKRLWRGRDNTCLPKSNFRGVEHELQPASKDWETNISSPKFELEFFVFGRFGYLLLICCQRNRLSSDRVTGITATFKNVKSLIL